MPETPIVSNSPSPAGGTATKVLDAVIQLEFNNAVMGRIMENKVALDAASVRFATEKFTDQAIDQKAVKKCVETAEDTLSLIEKGEAYYRDRLFPNGKKEDNAGSSGKPVELLISALSLTVEHNLELLSLDKKHVLKLKENFEGFLPKAEVAVGADTKNPAMQEKKPDDVNVLKPEQG